MQAIIIQMMKSTQAINYISFISKITPIIKKRALSPSVALASKDSKECLSSLQKRLEKINKSDVLGDRLNNNRQLDRQSHKEAENQAAGTHSAEKECNFITNNKINLYEVFRQNLVRKKEFLKKMIADEQTMLWKSSLTESQEQNRPAQQLNICNHSCVNTRTRKQSLSGLTFIKKKYTFNNHLLVPMVENYSCNKLKLERIHRTPVKGSRRNLQANSKIKGSLRERKLDYKPLFKVKQFQRQKLPKLGVDAKRIKFPAVFKKEQNDLRKRRIKTEACTVERVRPSGRVQFNSTYKFVGWEFDAQEDGPSLMER